MTDAIWLQPMKLSGSIATLVPLSTSHCPELIDSVCDGELWNLWYTSIPVPELMHSEIDRRLRLQSEGKMLPFTVLLAETGAAVGMTSYMHLDAFNRRLEIGSTWYRHTVQRTGLNTECKLMLLTHAFEKLNCIAVEFRTSSFNIPSRQGIERLGAKLDGVLRNHMFHTNGTMRDTYVYSIVESEWPSVKENLTWQLLRKREN